MQHNYHNCLSIRITVRELYEANIYGRYAPACCAYNNFTLPLLFTWSWTIHVRAHPKPNRLCIFILYKISYIIIILSPLAIKAQFHWASLDRINTTRWSVGRAHHITTCIMFHIWKDMYLHMWWCNIIWYRNYSGTPI